MSEPDRLGVLTRLVPVRLVNCSASGCLFESNVRLDVGAIGSLRITVNGDKYVEAVRIVRCQVIAGAGSLHHVAAQFLWTATPEPRTLRYAFGCGLSDRHGAESHIVM